MLDRLKQTNRDRRAIDTESGGSEDDQGSGKRLPHRVRIARSATLVAFTFATGVLVGHGLPGGPGVADADSSLTGRPEFSTLEDTWELIHAQ